MKFLIKIGKQVLNIFCSFHDVKKCTHGCNMSLCALKMAEKNSRVRYNRVWWAELSRWDSPRTKEPANSASNRNLEVSQSHRRESWLVAGKVLARCCVESSPSARRKGNSSNLICVEAMCKPAFCQRRALSCLTLLIYLHWAKEERIPSEALCFYLNNSIMITKGCRQQVACLLKHQSYCAQIWAYKSYTLRPW